MDDGRASALVFDAMSTVSRLIDLSSDTFESDGSEAGNGNSPIESREICRDKGCCWPAGLRSDEAVSTRDACLAACGSGTYLKSSKYVLLSTRNSCASILILVRIAHVFLGSLVQHIAWWMLPLQDLARS